MLFNPAEFIRNSQTGLFQNIDEMTAPGFQVVQQQSVPNRFTPTFVPQFRPETPAPEPIRPITDASVRRPVPQETALFPETPLAPVIDSTAPVRRPIDTPAPVEVPSPARRPIGTPAPVEVPAPSRRPVQNPQRQRRPVETPAPRPVETPAPVRDFANFQAFQPIQPEQQQVFEPAPVTTRPVDSLPPVTPFTVFNQQVRPQPVEPQVQPVQPQVQPVQPQAVQVPIQLEEVRNIPSGGNQQVLVPLEPTQPEPVVTTTATTTATTTTSTTTTTTETTVTTTTTAKPTRTRFRTRQRVAFR